MDEKNLSGSRPLAAFSRSVLLVGIITSAAALFSLGVNGGTRVPSDELSRVFCDTSAEKDEKKDDQRPEKQESSKESEKLQITEPGAPAHKRKILLA